MILGVVEEAVSLGASRRAASRAVGLDPRTLERWRAQGIGDDNRAGPQSAPENSLTPQERAQILAVANSKEFRDMSPQQIVPILAERGKYLASESSFYRVLRAEGQMARRDAARAPQKRHKPPELVATGPNQVWSWDITYLRSPVRGSFFYLYVVLDVWSRKIVGAAVHESESGEHASELIEDACRREGVRRDQLTLHSDNGSPMKGATLLATLQQLGVMPTFSRPSVKDDNPYSEALFRTVKYRPGFPRRAFKGLAHAQEWVADFIRWYNTEHRHSAIRFVTPAQRHAGQDRAILRKRVAVYRRARANNPSRWSGRTRNWSHVSTVKLNPEPAQQAVAA